MQSVWNQVQKFPQAILLGIYAIFFVIFFSFQTKNPNTFVQDEQYKYLQVQELIEKGFTQFDRKVEETRNPKGEEFSQFHPPFVYTFSGKEFFTFPWSFAFLVAVFVKWFGFWGTFIIPAIFGYLSVFIFFKLILHLSNDETISFQSTLFYIFCTPLLIYSTWLYEATLTNFLFFFFLYQFYKSDSFSSIFLCSFLLGIIAFFRLEIVVYSGFFLLYSFLFENRKKQILLIYSIFLIFLGLQFWMNHFATGFFLPIRLMTTGQDHFTLTFRLFRILEYWFLSQYSFLFYFPVCIFSFWIFTSKIVSKEKLLVLGGITTWTIAPFFGPNQQGMDLSPRYFFPILPIFGYVTLFILKERFSKWKRLLLTLLFLLPMLRMVLMLGILVQTQKVYDSTHEFFRKTLNTKVISSTENVNNFLYNLSELEVYTPTTLPKAKEWLAYNRDARFSLVCIDDQGECNRKNTTEVRCPWDCKEFLKSIDPKAELSTVPNLPILKYYNKK